MKKKELLKLIQYDHIRYYGYNRKNNFFYLCIDSLENKSFAYLLWTRIYQYYLFKNKNTPLLYFIIRSIRKHYSYLTGIQIPKTVKIGKGLFFPHYSNIVMASDVEIGDNCSIHQGVTIGRIFSGEKCGCPKLGNNVIIFAGAKVLGNIKIGNNCIIGANAVVLQDIPDNCVAAGIPAKIISTNSSHVLNENWKNFFYKNENISLNKE